MAETLKIDNFGPIVKANLKLGKTTILIGEQSSGKSTIAKLIAIFRDYTLLDAFNPAIKASLSKLLGDKFIKYQLSKYFNEKTSIHFENDYYALSYRDKKFEIIAIGSFAKRLEELEGIYEAGDVLNSEEYKIWEAKVRENITSDSPIYRSIVSSSETHKVRVFFGYYSREVVKQSYYIPAERILISTLARSIFTLLGGQISLPGFLLDFASKYEFARNKHSNLHIEVLGVNFLSSEGKDTIIDNNAELEISEASSGIQSLVPLIVAITGSKRLDHTLPLFDTYVIEEPELSLYPSTQLKLINFLAENCTDADNELIITTHSPYVLTALNNLLFAYKTAEKRPNSRKQIDKIIPEASWLNPEEFSAYYVGKGTVKSIHDKKTGLIGDNHLDDASYEVSDTFDALMEIYKD